MIILKTLMIALWLYVAYEYYTNLVDGKTEGVLTGIILFLTILTIIL